MLPRSVSADIEMIRRQIEEVRKIDPSVSGEVISMATQFICIAIAGRLEQGLKELVKEYARKRSSTDLDRALTRLCGQFQNPKPPKILELVELFSREARQSLESDWAAESDAIKESLAALISTRIQIAHQTSRNVGVSIESVSNYFEAYRRTMNDVAERLN